MNEEDMMKDEAAAKDATAEETTGLMIPLPEGIEGAEDGKPFEATVSGTVSGEDGKMMLTVESINGQPIPQDSDAEAEGIKDIENELTAKLKQRDGGEVDSEGGMME